MRYLDVISKKYDHYLLGAVVLLCIVGTVMLFSASNSISLDQTQRITATVYLQAHLKRLLIGIAMMFAAMIYLGFGLNAFFVVSQVFVANTFGRQHIGAIRGVMGTVNNMATFGGPWLFGVMYDVSAQYFVLFAVAVGFWLVTIIMGILVRPLVRTIPEVVPGKGRT